MKNSLLVIALAILSTLVSCSSEDLYLSELDEKKYISLDGSPVITIDKNELRWYAVKIQDCWNHTKSTPPFRLVRQDENSALFQIVTDEPDYIKVSRQEEGIRIEATWGEPFYVVPTDDCVADF